MIHFILTVISVITAFVGLSHLHQFEKTRCDFEFDHIAGAAFTCSSCFSMCRTHDLGSDDDPKGPNCC